MNTTVNRGHLPFDNAIKGHTSSLDLDGLAQLDEELRTWLPQLRRNAVAKQHSEFERLGAVRLPTKLPLDETTNVRSEAMFREALDMTRFDWQRGQLAAGRGYITMPPANDTKLAYPANGRQMASSPTGALFASFHESGHAAYDQGVPAHLWELPAGLTDDKAFHESMAFVFEMWMARDPRFADVASALLTQVHGNDDSGAFAPDNLRRLNKLIVTPDIFADDDARSLAKHHVRNDVDMLLGIIITTRLEIELFDGAIKPEDLPTRILGLREAYGLEHGGKNAIADAKTQLMQNGQWPNGHFGYIPLYVPAIVWAAQIGETITHDLGDAAVGSAFGSGELGPILGWLSDKLWSRGRAYETQGDLVHMATGKPITTDPLRRLMEERYGVSSAGEDAAAAAFSLDPLNAGNAGSGTRHGGGSSGGGSATARRKAAEEKARLAKAKEDLRSFEECEALF
jgi:carboxypeptidase Taq